MINKNRIVPVQQIDLLTLIGTILGLIGTSYSVLAATTIDGVFSVTGSGAVGNKLVNQPVHTLDFASGVTSGVVYFVGAYDFAGITVNGAAAYADGSATVNPDCATLYKAELADGSVTVTAVSPVA